MAKAATLDEPAGMEKAEIKRHLRFAREEPISVAFALGGDGKAILQLDKRKPGRALEKQLKDAAPDSKSHRWGTALVDPDDAKTIRFTVNKAGGGLARKLIVALKGTGFNKVKIQLEDGTELEAHEEADEEDKDASEARPAAAPAAEAGAAADAAPEPAESTMGAAAEGAAADAGAAPATASEASAAPEAAAAPPAGQPNAAVLAKDLTALVKRMLVVISKDSTQKAALTEMATDAQVSLKRGDLEQAGAGIDIFREALNDCEAAINGGGQKSAAAGAAPTSAAPTGAAPTSAAPTGATSNGAAAPQAQGNQAGHQNGTQPSGTGGIAPDLIKEGEAILASLTGALKKLMPMLGMVPGLGELVKAVVPAVQSAVKAGEIERAREGLQQVLEAVAKGQMGGVAGGMSGGVGGGVGQAAGAAASAADHQKHREHAAKQAPAIDKASNVWGATRQRVMAEVEKLEKAFTSALDGHGMMADLTKTLQGKVESTLHHLDDRLMHALAAVNKAPDAAERAKHVEHAHKLLQHYQTHVSSDKTIKMLDSNPFHPLAIEKTVMSSLAALQKTIH